MVYPRFPRVNRIGVDQDNYNQFQYLKKYFNMNYMAEEYLKTGVHAYESTHGYHLMLYKRMRTILENMTVRYTMGDCMGRLVIDEENISDQLSEFAEVLHEEKNGNKIHETRVDPLSQPFWNVRNHEGVTCYFKGN